MMSIGINSFSILNIHGVDYCYIMNGVSKSEAMDFLNKVDLYEKSVSL